MLLLFVQVSVNSESDLLFIKNCDSMKVPCPFPIRPSHIMDYHSFNTNIKLVLKMIECTVNATHNDYILFKSLFEVDYNPVEITSFLEYTKYAFCPTVCFIQVSYAVEEMSNVDLIVKCDKEFAFKCTVYKWRCDGWPREKYEDEFIAMIQDVILKKSTRDMYLLLLYICVYMIVIGVILFGIKYI